tara:strand:- start:5075 stop:5905 length:831 start_codon:yes stop_codon:yes gene_type:complete
MAKKKETTKVEEPVVEETVVIEQPKVEAPKIKAKPKNTWEIKDRVYYLKGRKKPLSYTIRASSLFWFDEEKGFERELKYCQNQRTCFVDEMKGEQRLEHITFRSGTLFVEKEKTVLQKFLSLYHPHNGKVFYEHKPVEIAANQIDRLEMEADAIVLARQIDIDMAEAIMRVEKGSEVSTMSSKELKRDLLVFARQNPVLFLELASDDNIQLRNFGIKAVEEGIIKLSADQRYFLWATTDRKIMTVPFDEHPYTALSHWFKTDEGMEIFNQIEKRFN